MWIENRKSYRIRQGICAILGICVSFVFLSVILDRQEVKAAKQVADAQVKLADEVFRFHVLANSDDAADQKLKLKVRDRVLSYMRGFIADGKKESVEAWALEHLSEIEQEALEVIRAEGYEYSVKAQVTKCYFPDRRYGEVLFPKGYYEALRIEIGDALGHNWWCVLYPSLCFMDATCAAVTEEGEKELEQVLDTATFETVTKTPANYKIKSFFFELFRERTD